MLKVLSYSNKKKHKKALSTIEKAIALNGKKSTYVITKGQILYEINEDIGEFFSYLGKAVKVEPNSAIPLIERAYYYEKINRFQDAIMDYNDAIKLAKVDSVKKTIYINRGGLFTKLQKPELGYADLTKAQEIDSNDVGMLNNLAIALDDLGRKDECFDALKRIVEIDSVFAPAWVNLGFHASLRERYEEALEYLNQADKLSPNEAYTLNNRGYVKFKLKDIKGALNDINKSIELNSNNSYAYRNKALIYLSEKKMDTACENLQLAKDKGFSLYYGEEVNDLIKKHCIK